MKIKHLEVKIKEFQKKPNIFTLISIPKDLIELSQI